MSVRISASPSSLFPLPTFQNNIKTSLSSKLTSYPTPPSSNSHLNLKSHHGRRLPGPIRREFASLRAVKCRSNNNNNPGDPASGDNGSRSVLDAFFLGKALAEAINERIESTVGELLSTVGRLQAEQQKQVQDFQDDVLERAKKAKEKAAREAMEAQGNIPYKSTSSAAEVVSSEVVTVEISPSSSRSEQINNTNNNDPLL